jgi:hypothetical protein
MILLIPHRSRHQRRHARRVEQQTLHRDRLPTDSVLIPPSSDPEKSMKSMSESVITLIVVIGGVAPVNS